MCIGCKEEKIYPGTWGHIWERTDVIEGIQCKINSSLHKIEGTPRRGNNFKNKEIFREQMISVQFSLIYKGLYCSQSIIQIIWNQLLG